MKNKDVEEGKVFAFLGIFLTIIGFFIVLLAKKDNKYAMFYAKQGLVLFIAYVIVAVLGMIPFIGWFIIWPVGYLLLLIFWIIGIVYSLSGEEKDIPIIGGFAKKINL
ncbi:hypothetical protein HOL21_00995 [Candidatus Woesearchaeota archaeon]|jgi:uncharacterized membrane protein|nr:hypothetical protein [Candidatus Woesearchaeota archaeon]MBT5396772.1 hypothetical protein [Candidatus Woesearchaeota archaeon]MBT5924585.1 hypothetical protein [Candidatus Woesearchaeota archaeon]MBT6367660.1 hypothetical protein [Candidatus Woesearchaeota archaeon]MBT7762939.1 hypothetical protein [Candidatus Woesearchaeota archaeon]